jgi:uncharacterized protein (TIGR02145 family)
MYSGIDKNITIEVFDMMGKSRLAFQQRVKKGRAKFAINHLPSGVYLVNVKSIDDQKTILLISQNTNLSSKESITCLTQSEPKMFANKGEKNTSNLVEMQYNEGDRLLIKGFSNDFITVKSIIPTESITETFEFYACTDVNNNHYSTVTIGEQVWMGEDLQTTHYPNGDAIPNVTSNDDWGNLEDNNIDDAYCFQDNNSNSEYGALYSYAAAIADNWERDNNPGQGICPEAWHLPTKEEWSSLRTFLGGQYAAGGKMKETGTNHWDAPNEGADNSSAFTALPGGQRSYSSGNFMQLGYMAWWWASDEESGPSAYTFCVEADYPDAGISSRHKSRAYSVRCIMD